MEVGIDGKQTGAGDLPGVQELRSSVKLLIVTASYTEGELFCCLK